MTGLAIGGLTAGLIASKLKKKPGETKADTTPAVAPPPSSADGEIKPPLVDAAANNAAALLAGEKQRKSAARGNALARPLKLKKPGVAGAAVPLRPKTLIGGY